MGCAILSNDQNYTIFKYGRHVIRFRAPYSLEHYTSVKEWDHGYLVVMAKYTHNSQEEEEYISVKEWDHGYLVVMAKYTHNSQEEEEYIDLIPILESLYFDADEFLKPIKEVRIEYERY